MARRTKAEIRHIKGWIYSLCDLYKPMTVRQLFYALTTEGVIDKTEQEYKNTVCRLTKLMRLSGELPWHCLADNTRWMHKPRTYGGISDCLAQAQRAYRRSLWDPATNPNYVEVWLEKDALTGVFYEVTEEYDVPLMPCKGYPSLSFIRQAAETLTHQIHSRYRLADGVIVAGNMPSATVYYFGDFDPSGVDISRSTEARLREFITELSGGDDFLQRYFHFQRVAVNHEQIACMGLPTRPTKKTDSRSAKFGYDVSVEVDAIKPDQLREMIRDCIERHVDQHQLDSIRAIEEEEKSMLLQVSDFSRLAGPAGLARRLAD